jgi:hypothetical protein
MRKLSLVAALGALVIHGGASASTVSLVWTGASDPAVVGIGTSVADVSGAAGPVLLTLDVMIGADAAGLSSAGLDLEFDTDGANELDLVSWSELSWANAKASRTLEQLSPGIVRTQESGPGGPEGQAFGFETFTLGSGPANLTFAFARIVFSTHPLRASTDGDDIFSTNERDPSATVFFNNLGQLIATGPLSASVIPEPGTVALVGAGLLGLAAAMRRRR